jgi:hypothetical protein
MITLVLIDLASLITFILDVNKSEVTFEDEFDEVMIADVFKKAFKLDYLNPSEFSWGQTEKIITRTNL